MSTVVIALLALVIVAAVVAVLVRSRHGTAHLDEHPYATRDSEPVFGSAGSASPKTGADAALAAALAAAADLPSGIHPIEGRVERGPPLPVVLVHGLFGFDQIGVPGVKVHYFRGIVDHLASLGCHAHAVRLARAASVPERAQMLVDAIEKLGHSRIDIIAHSLGGLDARYALSRLGLSERVRSLVTIGTPHRGSPLADLATDGPLGLARKTIATLGVPLEAVDWLSTAALERFNREILDVPGVRYACVVGGIRSPSTPVSLAIAPAHAFLRRVAGANDGLVPMTSQYWGETLAEIEADHFEQVGWRMPMRGSFDALALYAFVVARLGDVPPSANSSAQRTAQ